MLLGTSGRITGHRGLGANRVVLRERENTARACLRALEAGADSVEIDIQLSSDDELVVYHDARTLHGARIGEQPYEALRAHGIERLEDLLAALPAEANGKSVGVNLEIKTGYDLHETNLDYRAVEAVAAGLPRWSDKHDIVVSCFDPVAVKRLVALRDTAPNVPIGYLTENPHTRDGAPVTVADAIKTATALGCDTLHLNDKLLVLPEPRLREAVAQVHEAGLLLLVWCPPPEHAVELLEAGADAVCVNWVPETVAAAGRSSQR